MNIVPAFTFPNYTQDMIESWLLEEEFQTDVRTIDKPKTCTGLQALSPSCLKLKIMQLRKNGQQQ